MYLTFVCTWASPISGNNKYCEIKIKKVRGFFLHKFFQPPFTTNNTTQPDFTKNPLCLMNMYGNVT